ncbi:MAG: LeuD/DmdB family oxidoreductase small subunit [Candidatus Odinarchaeia archaeon]
MRIKGKVIKYGDHIDTDVIIAGHRLVHGSNIKLMAQYAMESIDKDFHRKISEGASIIVGGRNFGSGSSRQQAPEVLKESGIKLIIADSVARIFYRNCINIGLPILIADGISSIVEEGNTLEVDLNTGIIKNLTNNKEIKSKPIPPFLMEILNDGGLINNLKKKLNLT